jgi:hypothetical protein
MTPDKPRPGEMLIRTKIAELDARVQKLAEQMTSGLIGPRVARARRRWVHQDYAKLTKLARHYGFNVQD